MSNILNKYINSKVYKITNNINNICYVGSTTRALITRFSGHKSNYKIWLNDIDHTIQCTSYILFYNYGLENCTIEELYTCNSLSELKEKEAFYIKLLNTVNKVTPSINMENNFCNICNKQYISYQSLWNHNKKFHKANQLLNENNLLSNENNLSSNKNNLPNSINNTNSINNNTNSINNNVTLKYIEKLSIPSLQCPYCEKFYKFASSKCVHMKSCKLSHPEIIIVNNKNICCYCNKKFNCIRTTYYHKKICDKKQEQISIINNNTTNNINII